MSLLKRIHHVAYRCHDAKETALWYKDILDMDLTVSISEEHVPSTKEPDPYMHIFLDAGMGNVLAFFELTNQEKMDRDNNTPTWVQHIAFEVESLDVLEKTKETLISKGLDVLGVTDHGVFKSIYFFDPNGHRLELCANTGSRKQMEKLKEIAFDMLEEWSTTKKPPRQAAWLHDREFLDDK